MRRAIRVGLAMVLTFAGATVLGASGAQAQTATEPSCGGVLSGGGDGPLTKEIIAQQPVGNGMWQLTIRVTSPRSGNVRVRDCAFVDANNNGQYDSGEQLLVGVDFTRAITANTPFTFTTTISAQAGARICDRVALSGRTGTLLGTDYTDKSNIACVTLGTPPPPVIPEVPLAVVLPLVAAGLFGGAVLINRRRERGMAAAA